MKKKNTKRFGELAEIQFLWKASQLGFRVLKPYGDSDPYDFVIDNGHRLFRMQVKSTTCFAHRHYAVRVKHAAKDAPYLKRSVDFFAAWVQPFDAWYIVPIRAIGNQRDAIFFPHVPDSRGRFEIYREAWHLLEKKPRSRGRHPATRTIVMKSAA